MLINIKNNGLKINVSIKYLYVRWQKCFHNKQLLNKNIIKMK